MSDSASVLKALQRHINYEFGDEALLKLALTHRSATNQHNERLEFLGDAVLGLVTGQVLYHQFPKAREGQLSRLRSSLVRGNTLAELAREFKLGDYLHLGISELKTGGTDRDSILEDAMEALIGAIYLDSDFDTVQRIMLVWFQTRLDELSIDMPTRDAKTRLQEYMQGKGLALPQYETVDTTGAEHKQTFHVKCSLVPLGLSSLGIGKSRKAAEQVAAKAMLEQLEKADG